MRVINGFVLGAKQAADKRVHEQKKRVNELERELAQLKGEEAPQLQELPDIEWGIHYSVHNIYVLITSILNLCIKIPKVAQSERDYIYIWPIYSSEGTEKLCMKFFYFHSTLYRVNLYDQ